MNIQANLNQLLNLGVAAYRISPLYEAKQAEAENAAREKVIEKKAKKPTSSDDSKIEIKPKKPSSAWGRYQEAKRKAAEAYEIRAEERIAAESIKMQNIVKRFKKYIDESKAAGTGPKTVYKENINNDNTK